jgi:hypothetical protein
VCGWVGVWVCGCIQGPKGVEQGEHTVRCEALCHARARQQERKRGEGGGGEGDFVKVAEG